MSFSPIRCGFWSRPSVGPPPLDAHLSDLTLIGGEPVQVSFDTTMFGNFEVMSLADSAILTASLRAIAR